MFEGFLRNLDLDKNISIMNFKPFSSCFIIYGSQNFQIMSAMSLETRFTTVNTIKEVLSISCLYFGSLFSQEIIRKHFFLNYV